jgi:hypothetical protein
MPVDAARVEDSTSRPVWVAVIPIVLSCDVIDAAVRPTAADASDRPESNPPRLDPNLTWTRSSDTYPPN